MFSFIKKIRAKRAGVPYHEDCFWPPFYVSFERKTRNTSRVLPNLYDAEIGDVVPVFEKDGVHYLYRLRGIGSVEWSGHDASPLQFDITFHSSAPAPRATDAITASNARIRPQLSCGQYS